MIQSAARKTASKAAKQAPNGVLSLYRFTVNDYHRMIDAGILTSNHKVELLEGWIVNKMPQNPPHRNANSRLYRWLAKLLPEEDWYLACQAPITLLDSEPEPDIVIARGPDSRYGNRHPGPGDILVVIEIADSSVMQDRRNKGPLYAGAKIPQFWLVNLQTKHAEIYTNPQAGRDPFYKNKMEMSATEAIPLVLDDKRFGEIKVKQLLS